MTSQEWNTATDVSAMLDALHGKVSDRKLRLFACSCYRHEWKFEPSCSELVKFMEEWADGYNAMPDALWDKVNSYIENEGIQREVILPDFWMDLENFTTDVDLAVDCAVNCVSVKNVTQDPFSLRCIFGTPFRPAVPLFRRVLSATGRVVVGVIAGSPFRTVAREPQLLANPSIESTQRTSTVLAIARQMYDSRDFSPAPVLADALQDAGCEDPAILEHLRGENRHVRGCWVVDGVLGRE